MQGETGCLFVTVQTASVAGAVVVVVAVVAAVVAVTIIVVVKAIIIVIIAAAVILIVIVVSGIGISHTDSCGVCRSARLTHRIRIIHNIHIIYTIYGTRNISIVNITDITHIRTFTDNTLPLPAGGRLISHSSCRLIDRSASAAASPRPPSGLRADRVHRQSEEFVHRAIVQTSPGGVCGWEGGGYNRE